MSNTQFTPGPDGKQNYEGYFISREGLFYHIDGIKATFLSFDAAKGHIDSLWKNSIKGMQDFLQQTTPNKANGKP